MAPLARFLSFFFLSAGFSCVGMYGIFGNCPALTPLLKKLSVPESEERFMKASEREKTIYILVSLA